MPKTVFGSVKDYIAAQPVAAQPALKRVRSIIRKALPAAEEGISYAIPTYKMQGHAVIYFSGWSKHYSLYPAGASLVGAFHDELAPYKINKATIRFPLAQPVPVKLIERIAKFRAAEIAKKQKSSVRP